MHTLVTRLAVFERLGLIMSFVAFQTIRDIAVFLVVATLAILLRMHTGKLSQLLLGTRMAISTGRTQALHSRNTERGMRVLVTAEAIGLLGAVLLAMTGRTKRHQLVVIVFTRTVGVKNLMTLLTGESMLTTGIFQVGKLAHMALTTICWL